MRTTNGATAPLPRRSEHVTHESTPASGGESQTVQALIDQVAGTTRLLGLTLLGLH